MRSRHLPTICFAVMCLIAGVAIFAAAHGTFFWGDDWSMMLNRHGLAPRTLLRPHLDHLVATQVVLYELLRSVARWHYGAYRFAAIVLHLAVATSVFLFARRRVGPWLAAALAAPMLLVSGYAAMWPALTGNLGSLVAGIAALLVLDRMAAGTLRDVVVFALLVVAVASFSYGLAFAGAVAVWLLATPGQRRSLWVPVVPAVAYLVWLLAYQPPNFLSADNLAATPEFIADSAAAAFAAVTGLGLEWGRLLVLAAAIAAAYELFTKPERRSAMAYALVSLPLLTWFLTGLARANLGPAEPTFGVGGQAADALATRFARLHGLFSAAQARYVYPSVVLLLLLAAQLLSGRRTRGAAAPIALVLFFGVVTNAVLLNQTGDVLRAVADGVRGRIAAVELAARTPHPTVYLQIFPGGPEANRLFIANFYEPNFRRTVRDTGQEPVPLSALSAIGPGGRVSLDASVLTILPPHFAPTAFHGSSVRCIRFATGSGTTTLEHGAARIRATASPAVVYLRRFADPAGPSHIGTVAAHSVYALSIAPDRSPRPWLVTIRSTGPVDVCP